MKEWTCEKKFVISHKNPPSNKLPTSVTNHHSPDIFFPSAQSTQKTLKYPLEVIINSCNRKFRVHCLVVDDKFETFGVVVNGGSVNPMICGEVGRLWHRAANSVGSNSIVTSRKVLVLNLPKLDLNASDGDIKGKLKKSAMFTGAFGTPCIFYTTWRLR